MSYKTFDRAVRIKQLLYDHAIWCGCEDSQLSAIEIAKIVRCNPQTVMNAISRYGDRVGIGVREEAYRPSGVCKIRYRFYSLDSSYTNMRLWEFER